MTDLSVLLVSWNSAAHITSALDSLPAACAELAHEVVVVDNGSGDGSVLLLQGRADLRLIPLGENTGFTHAANVAAAAATGRLLLFLNPDVVCPPGSLTRLVAALDDRPDAWGATPWFRFPDGRPQYFWRRFTGPLATVLCFTRSGRRVDRLLGRPAARRRGYADLADPPGDMVIEGVGAACLLVRREEFLATGGFDERYFNFFQDGELERRMTRAGRALLGVGTVEVSHVAGATLRRLPDWEVDAQMVHALRQFLLDEPRRTRWPFAVAVRVDQLLPGPGGAARRRRALAAVSRRRTGSPVPPPTAAR